MWFLASKKSIVESGLLNDFVDYHSHILPGVDDGIDTMEKSIKVLKTYEEWGVSDVWFTPHIMEDYPNDIAKLKELFGDLCQSYAKVAGDGAVALHLASENMLDSLFMERLGKNDLLPMIDGKHLLVETSYYSPPFGFEVMLDCIKSKGYIPVLAHPERYMYMSMSDYNALYKKGVKFQLNITSLAGAYGEEVLKKAKELLKKGFYSVSGSDLHRLSSFKDWINVPIKKGLVRKMKLD